MDKAIVAELELGPCVLAPKDNGKYYMLARFSDSKKAVEYAGWLNRHNEGEWADESGRWLPLKELGLEPQIYQTSPLDALEVKD